MDREYGKYRMLISKTEEGMDSEGGGGCGQGKRQKNRARAE